MRIILTIVYWLDYEEWSPAFLPCCNFCRVGCAVSDWIRQSAKPHSRFERSGSFYIPLGKLYHFWGETESWQWLKLICYSGMIILDGKIINGSVHCSWQSDQFSTRCEPATTFPCPFGSALRIAAAAGTCWHHFLPWFRIGIPPLTIFCRS